MAPATALIIKYDTTEDQIAELGASFRDVTFDTPANYEVGRRAIAQVRSLRTAVEKRRKELKADSLAFGKLVDGLARELTEKLEAIEAPLLAAKKTIDDEEERLKRDKERADIIALEAKLKAEREEAEARSKLEREAEEARMSVERERLAAERARQDEANRAIAEAQRIEREKLDAEKSALDAQRREIEAAQRESARVETERQRSEQAERDRIAAEDAAAAEKARIDSMRPEIEKVHAFAADVRSLADRGPAVESVECRKALDWAFAKLKFVADGLQAFKGKVGP